MQEYISKAKELNELIEEMYVLSSEADYADLCNKFESIYLDQDGQVDKNFRHEYASISGKIRELNEENINGEKVYSIDNLLENISNLYDFAVKSKKPYVKNLFKLKDHIGLEAGRISSVEEMKWQITNGQESVTAKLDYMNELALHMAEQLHNSANTLSHLQLLEKQNEENIKKAQDTLDSLDKSADEVEAKIESVHNDSITILGIFASIVLSFTAGIVFTSSVLQNIDKASPFRLVGITLLIGFVIINVITILLAYINKIRAVKYTKIVYPRCVTFLNAFIIFAFLVDVALWIFMCKPYGLFI